MRGKPKGLNVKNTNTEDENGTVSWQRVSVATDNGTRISVTGVAPTQWIVGAGIQQLQDGETVRPFTGMSVE